MSVIFTRKDKIISGILIILIVVAVLISYYEKRHSVIEKTLTMEDLDTDYDIGKNIDITAALGNTVDISQSSYLRYAVASDTPQFVVLSFDGSKSVDMLNETLDFQSKLKAEGKSLYFTYFINASYLLTDQNAQFYTAPRQPAGKSSIGFSTTLTEIPARVRGFNKAMALGNEVGSHSVGHYDGSTWSYDEWKQEFTSFNNVLSSVRENNPTVAIDIPAFSSTTIVGFRAPQLGVNNNLYQTLHNFHFTYDASGVGKPEQWPVKDIYGTWLFPLGVIRLGPSQAPVIAMDYSIWMHQSQVKEVAKKGTPLWQQYYSELEKAYMDYFNTNYNGTKAPVIIGHHFSKWNDGVYWEAMKTFAENVCGKPQVRCVTFSSLANYLNTQGAPKIIQ